MPLKVYGVLKGKVHAMRASMEGNPHYHLWLKADNRNYRASINVRSMFRPAEVEYCIQLRFCHPLTRMLPRLSPGFHRLESCPGRLALDYIRYNLVDRDQFLTLPCEGPLCGADLNEVLDGVLLSAMHDPDAWVYVYGEPWEAQATDRVFRFSPSLGMHDIHMNQGNGPNHYEQDGVWQDGAVFIHHPQSNLWKAIFLKFQSQSWHTDDATGHALSPPKSYNGEPYPVDRNGVPRPDGMVRIISAMVARQNGKGPERHESVTLLNVCPFPVDLTGWSITNQNKQRLKLRGRLEAGEAREFHLGASVPLGDQGGIITLVNRDGFKVHGVSYTAEQACRDGWRLVF